MNALTPTYEMTAGGPIVKDKLWYFGAGRFTKPERGLNFAVTGGNYQTGGQPAPPRDGLGALSDLFDLFHFEHD